MRSRFIIFFVFAFLAVKAQAQIPDCSKFRDGRYRIADARAGTVTIADRRGGYQTESSESLKAVVRFRVNWQDNCNYTLKLDKVIRNENKIDFPSGLEIKIRITQTSANSYLQEVSSPMVNGTYTVEVVKID